MRIGVISELVTLREGLRELILRRWPRGCDVITIAAGRAAIVRVLQERFDLIVVTESPFGRAFLHELRAVGDATPVARLVQG